jgi:murein DD-endopeptidase MepM/ murein hydrolase activator NlpD
MRRALAALALVLLLAGAGGAGATSFTVVLNGTAVHASGLPSAEKPNAPGGIAVPYPLSSPPQDPVVLSYEQLLSLWHRAGDAYGVPWEVLAAINKIESNFGRNMGPSSAGAVGWMQFMPDTWMRWGLDASGDGLSDPWNPDDAIFAASRYLAAAGAQDDLSRAVFAYNHAQWYVDDVLALAADFGDGTSFELASQSSGEAVFRLAELEQQVADARKQVVRAREAIPRLQQEIDERADAQLELEVLAGDPTIATEKFRSVEERIARNERRQERARSLLAEKQATLETALADLESLKSDLSAAAVSAPAAASFGGALSVGDYVFPVGGGPGVVSVAHTHHDYPAADIAAPEGSPLFALANSVVTEAYPGGKGKCGTGLKLRLDSGAVYVYCHLSYLEPSVVPGAALAAGAPVGLVGSTGHATGPHLHLALVPAVSYPQEEPWFQSFAGKAFSWQDAPTPGVSGKPRERQFTIVSVSTAASSGRVVGFTR